MRKLQASCSPPGRDATELNTLRASSGRILAPEVKANPRNLRTWERDEQKDKDVGDVSATVLEKIIQMMANNIETITSGKHNFDGRKTSALKSDGKKKNMNTISSFWSYFIGSPALSPCQDAKGIDCSYRLTIK